MDILSHGGWSAIVYASRPRRSVWLAVFFGIAPDLISFSPHFITEGIAYHLRRFGPPDIASIPTYIFTLYNLTHSLIVWIAVSLIICLILRRVVWELGAWGLHIAIDIFSHDITFFPTPFLWPLNGFTFDGISWGKPWFLLTNYALLLITGALVILRRRKKLRP